MNSQSPIEFRPARPEDVETVLPMMRALEQVDPGDTPFDEKRRRSIFGKFVGDGTFGRAWLIYESGSPAGYVVLTLGFSFEYRGCDAFVDELYIAPQFRGRGIGKHTMAFVEQAALRLGVNALHLEVSANNSAALELYRRAGYEDHGRTLMTKWLVKRGP